jgi:hypothetical protein
LFGLFIDRLEAWLDERLPELGVTLGAEKLRLLLYADDLTLLATSPEDLQALLACPQTFCDQYQLHVNVAKCAVVVFGRRKPCPARDLLPGGWQYAGQSVPCVSEFGIWALFFMRPEMCLPALMHFTPLVCGLCGVCWAAVQMLG